jgi:hypothetical protein
MRIDANYGIDTDMYLVDVYLETEEESALEAAEIWKRLRSLLISQEIDIASVVEFFLYKQDKNAKWVSAGILPWSAE